MIFYTKWRFYEKCYSKHHTTLPLSRLDQYLALWDVSANIDDFIGDTIEIPSGKLTLTGNVTTDNIQELSKLFKNIKDEDTKQVELNLSGLESTGDPQELTFNYGSMSTFMDNLALTKVELPTRGTVILGVNAFKGCSNLKSITISSNVQIGDTNPFWGCHQLKFEVAPDHPDYITTQHKEALLGKPKAGEKGYTLVSYPSARGIVDLGELGYTITTIGKEALEYIPEGKITIIFPESVETIKYLAVNQENNAHETTIIMKGSTPPALPDESGNKYFATFYSESGIYVPDDSVEIYRKAPSWEYYADDIHPMSEYKPQ